MRYMIDLFAQLLTMVSVNKNTACFHFNIFSFSRSHSLLVEISNTSSISRYSARFCVSPSPLHLLHWYN